jgi:hypothetical protein
LNTWLHRTARCHNISFVPLYHLPPTILKLLYSLFSKTQSTFTTTNNEATSNKASMAHLNTATGKTASLPMRAKPKPKFKVSKVKKAGVHTSDSLGMSKVSKSRGTPLIY